MQRRQSLFSHVLLLIFILNFIKGSGPLIRRVRSAIINRSQQEPRTSKSRSTTVTFIDIIPDCLQNEIWSYLDLKSLLKLKNSCKFMENILNEYFKITIKKICPDCILHDSLINGIVHFILKDSIRLKASIVTILLH